MNRTIKNHALFLETPNHMDKDDATNMQDVLYKLVQYNDSTTAVVQSLFQSVNSLSSLVRSLTDSTTATDLTLENCISQVSKVETNIIGIESSNSVSEIERSRSKAIELVKQSGLDTLIYGLDFKKEIKNRDEINKVGKQAILDSLPSDRKNDVKKILDLPTTKVHPLGASTKMDTKRNIYSVPFVVKYDNTEYQKFPCNRAINSVQNLSTAICWPREIKAQIEKVKIYAKENYPDQHHRIRPSYRSGQIQILTRSADNNDKDRVFKLVKEFQAPILDSDIPKLRNNCYNPINSKNSN